MLIKRTRIRQLSRRGKIIKDIEDLLRARLKKERGDICEIHNKKCPNIGMMHILNKRRYPNLRFNQYNIILAGWFCSHFWTHQDPDDPRAQFALQRIKELRGEDYKEKLLLLAKTSPKMTMSYLTDYLFALKRL